MADLDAYAAIPISFVIRSRFELDNLWLGEFAEIAVEPRMKDYDALEPIATLAKRFDVSNWRMLAVSTAGAHSFGGGAIVAMRTPGLEMLEGRDDLAVLWDIRVHPVFRGQGVGRALFEHAQGVAKKNGCTELRVETQDTNVDACRFYRQMGCRLHSIHEDAYPELDEVKLIWTVRV